MQNTQPLIAPLSVDAVATYFAGAPQNGHLLNGPLCDSNSNIVSTSVFRGKRVRYPLSFLHWLVPASIAGFRVIAALRCCRVYSTVDSFSAHKWDSVPISLRFWKFLQKVLCVCFLRVFVAPFLHSLFSIFGAEICEPTATNSKHRALLFVSRISCAPIA